MAASGTTLRLLAGEMKLCFGSAEVLWLKFQKAEALLLTAVARHLAA